MAFFYDSSGATGKFEAAKKALQKDLVNVLKAEFTNAKAEIVARTQSGIDAEGGRFKSYSPGYELAKRRRLGGPSVPNLTLGVKHLSLKRNKNRPGKGAQKPPGMLRSIQQSVQATGAYIVCRLFFPATQADKARGNQAIRNFFNLSKSQIEKIERKIKEVINGSRR